MSLQICTHCGGPNGSPFCDACQNLKDLSTAAQVRFQRRRHLYNIHDWPPELEVTSTPTLPGLYTIKGGKQK